MDTLYIYALKVTWALVLYCESRYKVYLLASNALWEIEVSKAGMLIISIYIVVPAFRNKILLSLQFYQPTNIDIISLRSLTLMLDIISRSASRSSSSSSSYCHPQMRKNEFIKMMFLSCVNLLERSTLVPYWSLFNHSS